MTNPPIWQSPNNEEVIFNGVRSFVDGDTINIPFVFNPEVNVVRVNFLKGKLPFGVEARQTGIVGTLTPQFVEGGLIDFISPDTGQRVTGRIKELPGSISLIKVMAPISSPKEEQKLYGLRIEQILNNPTRVPTPPRDYSLTVRAIARATPAQKAAGIPDTFYEDRTFTIKGGLWFEPSGGIWHDPETGEVYNTDRTPFKIGDNLRENRALIMNFDPGRTIKKLEAIGGNLVPGLTFSEGTRRIAGLVGALPKDQFEYKVVLRATVETALGDLFQDKTFNFIVYPEDKPHSWLDQEWLASLPKIVNPSNTLDVIYSLGNVYRGSAINIQLRLNNPDGDMLTYKSTGYIHPNAFEGMPKGLKIDRHGRIVGAPTISLNQPGDYYFKIYVREPSGREGQPRTSEVIFRLRVLSEIRLDPQLSDAVNWETPAGLLGTTYETFPSHFEVKATPQFEATGIATNEIQSIQYRLADGSRSLPSTLYLDENTGQILGICPYVSSDSLYEFTVKATVVFTNTVTGVVRLSTISSQRTFSFIVKNLYTNNSVMSLYLAVPPIDRFELNHWVYGTKGEMNPSDVEIGTSTTADGVVRIFPIPPKLENKGEERIAVFYNNVPTTVPFYVITEFGQEKVVMSSPPPNGTEVTVYRYGEKIKDIIPGILKILGNDTLYRSNDPLWGKVEELRILLVNGLLNASNTELHRKLRDYHHTMKLRVGGLKWAKGYDPSGKYVYDMLYLSIYDTMEGAGGFDDIGRDVLLPMISKQAVPAWNLPANSDRYHAANINNARKDLIGRHFRTTWPGGGENNAADRGIGLSGKEGLPLWMSCEQIPGQPSSIIGYVPAIELAYLKPGAGAQAVKTLVQAGFEKNLRGKIIPIDRYLLVSDGLSATTFDLDIDAGIETSFDGPEATIPTADYTTFDQVLKPISKYYKFPPGDVHNS